MAWLVPLAAVMSVPTMGSFQVSTGYAITCAVNDGDATCWGELGLGGNETHSDSITYPPGKSIDFGTDHSGNDFLVDSMECGYYFCCALSAEKSVKC